MSLDRIHELNRCADLQRDCKYLGYLHACIDFKDLLVRHNVSIDFSSIDKLFSRFEQRERGSMI